MYTKRQTKRLSINVPVAVYNVLNRNRYALTPNQIVNHIIAQALIKPLAPPLTEPELAPKRMRRVNFLMHAFVYERVAAVANIRRTTVAEIVNQALLGDSSLFPPKLADDDDEPGDP